MKKINFGIIGCGRIAYKHAEAIKKNEKANLLCVCDVIKERAVDYKDKYGAQNHYTDYQELLKTQILMYQHRTPSGMHAWYRCGKGWQTRYRGKADGHVFARC